MQGKVTVIMPTYNGELFLEKQISSILNQTYKNYTLCIFDDNSVDNTVAIIKKFMKKDNRIKLKVNPKRKGVRKNVNDALNSIKSDFYFLADQDDFWLPEKMAKQLDILKNSNAIMSYTNLSLIDENGSLQCQDVWKSQKINPFNSNNIQFILIKSLVVGCTMAFRKELLELALPIPEKSEMHDHWLALHASLVKRIEPINEVLVLYRQHSSNVIGTFSSSKIRRKEVYSKFSAYNDYKDFKWATFTTKLLSLKEFDHRFDVNDKTMNFLKIYIWFYESLVLKKWWHLLINLYKLSPYQLKWHFIKTFLVARFYILFYFYHYFLVTTQRKIGQIFF